MKQSPRKEEIIFTIISEYIRLHSWQNQYRLTQKFYTLNKNPDLNFTAKCYRSFGVYFENISNNDSAFYFFKKAEKIYKALNNQYQLCRTYEDIALIQNYTNDILGCEQTLVMALRLAKKNKFNDLLTSINYSLGITSNELDQYDIAEMYYNEAIKIAKSINDTLSISICLNNLGYNYTKKKQYKTAEVCYNLALRNESSLIKLPPLEAMLYDNLAHANFCVGDFKTVQKLHKKASRIRDSLHIDQGKDFNRLYLSEYYAAIKDTSRAIAYAREAYRLSKSFKAPKDMLLCLKQLIRVEPLEALKYSGRYIQISDSMQRMERESRNKFAKIAYETEEITREKDEAIQQRQTIFTISLLVGSVLILILVILYQRHRQKGMLLIQQQHEANEEIFRLIQHQQLKLEEGRELEKKRIARELHDGVMNRLSSTRFNLHVLNKNPDAETLEKCIGYIEGLHDIEREIRDISHNLNNDVFGAKDSFGPLLNSLIAEQQKIVKADWHVDIEQEINWELVSSDVKINIYRIIQEALQNIRKHAGASKIILSLMQNDGRLVLEIYDDGRGFSLKGRKKGIGLQNIYSRVKACDGHINVVTRKGAGTNMTITIPVGNKLKPL